MTKRNRVSYGQRSIPDWAWIPFNLYLLHARRAISLLHVTMQGIAMVRGRPGAIELAAKIDKTLHEFDRGSGAAPAPASAETLKEAQEAAELAQSEVEQ